MTSQPSVLILTPVKNAALHLSRYFALLDRLTYPAQLISLGLLESDSTDGTYEAVNEHLADIGEGAGQPIGVAHWQGRDARRAGG